MSEFDFFERPILNSPYEYPSRHWELAEGLPTNRIEATYWVPGVNNLWTYGRWAFAELTDLYDFEKAFNLAIDTVAGAKA